MLHAALPLLAALALQDPGATPDRPAPPARIQVSGRVLTEGGRSFPDLQVAELWSFGPGDSAPVAPLPIDQFGNFFGTVNVVNGTVTLVAGAQGGAFVGVVVADVPAGENPRLSGLRIPLHAARRVRARLFAPRPRTIPIAGRELPAEPIEFLFIMEPQGAHVGTVLARGPELDAFLPPGDFSWWTFGRGVADRDGLFHVQVGPGIDDMGVLEFDLSALARLQGGPAPEWSFAEQRGLPEGRTKLADQRGRWLLLVFWTLDDGATVKRSFPHLARFWREERRAEEGEPRFEIVAIHGPGAASLEALEEAAREIPGGAPPPFPVLLDPRGDSAASFGVKGYPTMVLVDPQGRVVGSAQLEDLVSALRSAGRKAREDAR